MKSFSHVALWSFFVTLAAGCAGATGDAGGPPSTTPPASGSAGAPATTPAARPAIRTLAPVAKLTAACPLLSTGELKALLGGRSGTKITAAESRKHDSGTYICKYGTRAKAPFELVVAAIPATAFSPRQAIDAVVKRHRRDGTRIRTVHGVGAAAAFFVFADGTATFDAAKMSHGQIRMVIFQAPAIVPGRKFFDVVKLVTGRV